MHLTWNKKVTFLICFLINIIHLNECSTEADVKLSLATNKYVGDSIQPQQIKDFVADSVVAATANHPDDVVNESSQAKRLRSGAFGGVKHNFRSSYVDNKFKHRAGLAANVRNVADTSVDAAVPADSSVAGAPQKLPLFKPKQKSVNEFSDEVKYNVGPGVNISVEKDKELVSVYLDEDCLKDVFTGK